MITKDTSRRLDPAKVVDSALAIADDEGPAAVTFRRLAAQHDVTPMALYRHFKDKDDLLAALGDRMLMDVVLPEPTDERWDKQLHKLLTGLEWCLEGDETWGPIEAAMELIAAQAPGWYHEHVVAPFELDESEPDPGELDGMCRLCRRRRADVGFQLCDECARTAGGSAQ